VRRVKRKSNRKATTKKGKREEGPEGTSRKKKKVGAVQSGAKEERASAAG